MGTNSKQVFVFTSLLLISCVCVTARSYLRADGRTDTYTLIQQVFGGPSSAVEVPDCNHSSFGPHITQVFDESQNTSVFAFHAHIQIDDDRCLKFDRQRTEMKTNDNVPGGGLTGHFGDFLTLSWEFKLDSDFHPPYSFCHIHQLKAVGGDDSMPIITLTPRRSHPENMMQLIHMDSKGGYEIIGMVPLEPWLGHWVKVQSRVSLTHEGSYSFVASRKDDGEILMMNLSNGIDLWRNETNYVRPKWGIYRSVQERQVSRDEVVYFHDFCVGKGEDEMC